MLKSIKTVNARIALTTALLLFGAAAAHAGTVDISNSPPDVTATVDPNIVVTFDDSGSMDSTFMPDSNGDTTKKRFYSGAWNLIYFDPAKNYPPPLMPDGTSFPNASYVGAWRDGVCANRPSGGPTSCGVGDTGSVDLSTHFGDQYGGDTNVKNVSGQAIAGAFYTVYNPACGGVTNEACYSVVTLNGASAAVQQNFANFWSYYRTRNLMTRTALSRVFGPLGGDVRVTWQTINADWNGLTTRQINNLTKPSAWRTSFFNWLYAVGAGNSTPNRAATIMAGEFFKRSMTKDAMDPYWNGKTGTDALDLTCRQNFHILVTDGYWNEPGGARPDPNTIKPAGFVDVQGTPTLGDGTTAFSHLAVNKIYWNVPASSAGSCSNSGSIDCYPSLADIAFHYWATDLQPTLANKVPPYVPDTTTPLTGATVAINNPLATPEVYWNPHNDPATWQHVVQFFVTLGISGQRNFPGDYNNLLNGTLAWPQPARNEARAIDDTWHAAINSRGDYFSAGNPQELVDQLSQIILSIVQRRGSSVGVSVSSNILSSNTSGFAAGYDTAGWSGTLTSQNIDPATGDVLAINWDAGCVLTGGPCKTTGGNDYGAARPAPNARVIFTSRDGTPASGIPFRWASLTSAQQTVLNASDSRGSQRLDYLRGDRSQESATPALRKRNSLLGAIINSQPAFIAGPTGGFHDTYPAGSPEFNAAAAGNTFEKFVQDNLNRTPVVYVGSNDGMLHAFNAANTLSGNGGLEMWSYVPNILFTNGKLVSLTDPANADLVPTVDDTPLVQDVFFTPGGAGGTNGQWRTMLVQSLRYGGRGIAALDVTNPNVTEATAGTRVLWEFTKNSTATADGDPSHLGYTFASANIARLSVGWVVVVASGYFPATGPDSTDPAALSNQTSLFVLDAKTGALIKEIRTPATITSFGLSTPDLVDFGDDQIDDVAYAGDLAGNLWRFDLSSADKSQWVVERMMSTYDGVAANIGKQPITSMPVGFPVPAGAAATSGTQALMIVFGTGKYLGASDRTAAGTPQQYLYGIIDYGKGSTRYPILTSSLLAQTMTVDSSNRVHVTNNQLTSSTRGWKIALPTLGERDVVTPLPLFSAHLALFTTLIPSGNDPCDPSRTGHVFVLDVANGGYPTPRLSGQNGTSTPAEPLVKGCPVGDPTCVGVELKNPPISGDLGVGTVKGGEIKVIGTGMAFKTQVWRRGSWRDLLDY